jgi:hypothetical protein
MPNAKDLSSARMFEERAERASDPISRQHYKEMAAHYRSLSVEHQETTQPEHESCTTLLPPLRDEKPLVSPVRVSWPVDGRQRTGRQC